MGFREFIKKLTASFSARADERKQNSGPLDTTVVMTDQYGIEKKFDFLDALECNGHEYVILLPLEIPEANTVAVFRIEGEGEDETYVGVESKEEAETVYALFKERNRDFFEFQD